MDSRETRSRPIGRSRSIPSVPPRVGSRSRSDTASGRGRKRGHWARPCLHAPTGLKRAAVLGIAGPRSGVVRFEGLRDPRRTFCTGCRRYSLDDWLTEEFPGLSIAFYTKNWNWPGMDRGNPKFRVHPDSSAVLRDASTDYENASFYPYVNPRYIDLSDRYQPGEARCPKRGSHVSAPGWPTFGANAAMRGFAKKRAGHVPSRCTSDDSRGCRFYEIRTNQPSCLVEANLSDPGWQRIVREQLAQAEGVGSSGIYWDTLGNESHGDWDPRRVPGLNDRLVQATHDFVSDLSRGSEHRGTEFVREHASDFLNRAMPTAWVFAPQEIVAGHYLNIPLMSAIYHDRVVYGGPVPTKDEDLTALGLKWARFVTAGHAPGPMALHVLDKRDFVDGPIDGPREALVKRIASAREALVPHLSEGELLATFRISNQRGTSTLAQIGRWCAHFNCANAHTRRVGSVARVPAVQGAWWRGSDGSYVGVYANADPENAANAWVAVPEEFQGLVKEDCGPAEKPPCGSAAGVQGLRG